jgi:hypothetical protein
MHLERTRIAARLAGRAEAPPAGREAAPALQAAR